MVSDTGKTSRDDTYRAVNLPKQVEVEEVPSGLPQTVKLPRRQTVAAVEDRWRIDDEWWRQEPISRLYYEVLLVSGHILVLYKDLVKDRWYRQPY